MMCADDIPETGHWQSVERTWVFLIMMCVVQMTIQRPSATESKEDMGFYQSWCVQMTFQRPATDSQSRGIVLFLQSWCVLCRWHSRDQPLTDSWRSRLWLRMPGSLSTRWAMCSLVLTHSAPWSLLHCCPLSHMDIPTYRHTQSHIYGCTLTSHTYTHTHTPPYSTLHTHTYAYTCMHAHTSLPPLNPLTCQTHKVHVHTANNQFSGTVHSLKQHMPQCFSNP